MPNQVIDSLFVNRPQVKLMQWLYVDAPPKQRFPARELARRAGLPYGSIDRALKDLVKRELVVREDAPRGPEYRAPFEDPRLKHLFLLLREDSAIVTALKHALKSFKSVEYACVFGSFARGETHKGSDVDVLILESGDMDRFRVIGELSKVSDRIGREVNPQFYALSEFKRLVDEGEPIAVSILQEPRIDMKGVLPWPK
jgi:predicted nucleotidyltransferase